MHNHPANGKKKGRYLKICPKPSWLIKRKETWAKHVNENSITVFFLWELRGFTHNFHIHVSVSDFNSPWIGPHISCSRKDRPIVGIYKLLTDTWIWKLGLWPHHSFSWNICFEFSVLVLCSEYTPLTLLSQRKFVLTARNAEIYFLLYKSLEHLRNWKNWATSLI